MSKRSGKITKGASEIAKLIENIDWKNHDSPMPDDWGKPKLKDHPLALTYEDPTFQRNYLRQYAECLSNALGRVMEERDALERALSHAIDSNHGLVDWCEECEITHKLLRQLGRRGPSNEE